MKYIMNCFVCNKDYNINNFFRHRQSKKHKINLYDITMDLFYDEILNKYNDKTENDITIFDIYNYIYNTFGDEYIIKDNNNILYDTNNTNMNDDNKKVYHIKLLYSCM